MTDETKKTAKKTDGRTSIATVFTMRHPVGSKIMWGASMTIELLESCTDDHEKLVDMLITPTSRDGMSFNRKDAMLALDIIDQTTAEARAWINRWMPIYEKTLTVDNK